MTTYGYGKNKGKREVYTKDEIDNKVVNRSNIVVLRGKLDFVMEGTSASGSVEIDFPKGFTYDNCVAISFGVRNNTRSNSGFAFGNDELRYATADTTSILRGTCGKSVYFNETNNKIILKLQATVGSEWSQTETYNFEYKLVLMRYEVLDSEYTLGDVNQDGSITEEDLTLVQNYIEGTGALTEQQLKASDVNKDGYVDTGDTFKLQQYLNGVIDSLE